MRDSHKKNLVDALATVEEIGVERWDFLMWFHAENKIISTIVGIVAGMVLNSEKYSGYGVPIFAFANASEEGMVKVSGRGNRALVDRGLDLSAVVNKVGKELGGIGGGHNIAAGATIPAGKENEFLRAAEAMIKEQLIG